MTGAALALAEKIGAQQEAAEDRHAREVFAEHAGHSVFHLAETSPPAEPIAQSELVGNVEPADLPSEQDLLEQLAAVERAERAAARAVEENGMDYYISSRREGESGQHALVVAAPAGGIAIVAAAA